MVNPLRGEISANFDGRPWTLVLTLGALAELEQAFNAETLEGLLSRFASGALSASDMIKVIGAGLRGGGNPVTDDEVAAMTTTGGLGGFARITADLLCATFGATSSPTTQGGEDNNSRPFV